MSSQKKTDEEDVPPKDAAEDSTSLCAFPPKIFGPRVFSQTTEFTKPSNGHSAFTPRELSSYCVCEHCLEASGACWLPVHSVSYSSCWTFCMCLFWVQLMLALYEYSCQEEQKHSPSTQLRPILHGCDAGNKTTHLPEQ